MSRLVIFSEQPLPAHYLFTDLLTTAGIAPERQTFATAVSQEELQEIMSNGAEYMLLAGQQPLSLVRPDLSTKTACGRPFFWGEEEYGVIATINPETLQRNDVWADSVSMHLEALVAFGRRPEDLFEIAPRSCTECGNPNAPHRDMDLLPFCNAHQRSS